MENFVVTAEISEPIVTYGDGIHLDGPLAYATFMELTPEQKNKLPSIQNDWAEDFNLPLSKWSHDCDLPETSDGRLTTDGILEETETGYVGHVWGWRCSAAIPIGTVMESIYELRKRQPAIEAIIYLKDKRWETGAGPHKSKDLVYPSIITRKLKWYCNGDPERTHWLLSRYVRAIGKLSNHGQGKISRWIVEPTDIDLSIKDQFGNPMRRLPARMFDDKPILLGTIRAPYHHRSRWAMTVSPEVFHDRTIIE